MTATDTTRAVTTAARRSEGLSREILVLAGVVILGTIMTVLDLTVVNVAIPTLASDLGASIPTIQWVMTGYMLAFATVIPLTGWAAERFGARTGVDLRAAAVPGGFGARRGGLVDRLADRLPGAAGARRRDDPAHRPDHPGPGRGPAADGAGDERDRRADAAGPGVRAAARRGDHRRGQLAVDLLHQPAGGAGGRGGGAPAAARWVRGPGARGGLRLDVRGLLLLSPGIAVFLYGMSEAGGHGGFGSPRTSVAVLAGLALIGLFFWHAAGGAGRR